MRLKQNPLFRRVITPWYDSEAACWTVIVLMVAVLLFALAGLQVALQEPDYHKHVWMPVMLLLLSGGVVVSTLVRLIRRYSNRYSGR
jgi:NhaP-type Na+/H+ or K+/H+ antiporter